MEGVFTYFKNYQKRFTVFPQSEVELSFSDKCRLLVVIPCYDENLEMTLKSLECCALQNPAEVGVLLVFNHGEHADESIKQKHQAQAKKYQNQTLANGVLVTSMEAFDLPKKHAGVGLARKIGMDTASRFFASINYDGLLVCLDGDCTVSENYFTALLKAESKAVNGLSIAFEHQPSSDYQPEIMRYEIFLRYYIQALKFAGYKHAHHTIGSSMAVRCSKYLALGGMNKRKAGEDFYFLHKLMPHPKFFTLNACTVLPQARFSTRVPFGTGRAMLEMQQGTKDFKTLYHPTIFQAIKNWLSQIERVDLSEFPREINQFFKQEQLVEQFEILRKRSSTTQQFLENFYFWFDGFRMLKLVHFLRDEFYQNQDIIEAVNCLFNQRFKTTKQVHEFLHQLDLNEENALRIE